MEKEKILFAHIPKTAGQSINFMLTANFNLEYKYLMHVPLKTCYKDYNNYFKFTVVRDPILRCISAFYYIRRVIENKKKNKITKLLFIKLKLKEKINNIDKINKQTSNTKKQLKNVKQIKNLDKKITNIDVEIKNIKKLIKNNNQDNEDNENNKDNESDQDKEDKNRQFKYLKFNSIHKSLIANVRNKIYKKKLQRRNRIAQLLGGSIEQFIDNFEEFYNLIFHKKNINKIKFDNKKQADNCLWLPQYIYIYDNNYNLLVDKIFKMNEFYDYLIENNIIKINNYTYNNNNITDYSHLITDKFKDTIKKIYKKDYELLGNYF